MATPIATTRAPTIGTTEADRAPGIDKEAPSDRTLMIVLNLADPHRQPYRQEDTVPAIAERQPQANQHRSDRSDSRQPYREKDTVPVIASNNVYAAFYKALDNQ